MVSGIGAMMNAVAAAPVTNTPQVGAAGVTDATGLAGQAGQTGDSFGNVVTNALQGMQNSQDSANSLAVQAATGDLTDVHNYTIAATEASLQTEMTVAVRDRAVAAFNQIMSMQI
jgi:flagellar hook-basal body complex protein FliE